MKQKVIAQITPFMMDNHLIISLDAQWTEVYNGIPTFTVIIDKERRLHLITQPIPKTDQTNPKILEELK